MFCFWHVVKDEFHGGPFRWHFQQLQLLHAFRCEGDPPSRSIARAGLQRCSFVWSHIVDLTLQSVYFAWLSEASGHFTVWYTLMAQHACCSGWTLSRGYVTVGAQRSRRAERSRNTCLYVLYIYMQYPCILLSFCRS